MIIIRIPQKQRKKKNDTRSNTEGHLYRLRLNGMMTIHRRLVSLSLSKSLLVASTNPLIETKTWKYKPEFNFVKLDQNDLGKR